MFRSHGCSYLIKSLSFNLAEKERCIHVFCECEDKILPISPLKHKLWALIALSRHFS